VSVSGAIWQGVGGKTGRCTGKPINGEVLGTFFGEMYGETVYPQFTPVNIAGGSVRATLFCRREERPSTSRWSLPIRVHRT